MFFFFFFVDDCVSTFILNKYNHKYYKWFIELTVDAKISCGQHWSRKLLHTFGSLNFSVKRSPSPVKKKIYQNEWDRSTVQWYRNNNKNIKYCRISCHWHLASSQNSKCRFSLCNVNLRIFNYYYYYYLDGVFFKYFCCCCSMFEQKHDWWAHWNKIIFHFRRVRHICARVQNG